MNEVDEVIRELKKNKGFSGFVIMNNDGGFARASGVEGGATRREPAPRRAGIVIRHEQMEYKVAVHHAYLVRRARCRGPRRALRRAPRRCSTCARRPGST